MRPHECDLEGLPAEFQRPRTALIPMFTGFLSILGSYLVIREIGADRLRPGSASRQTDNHHTMRAPLARALLGISITDLLFSIAIAGSTIPTPRWQHHVPYALGNNGTCESQGFWLQFGNVAVPLYFTLLAFLYLVILRYQWTDKRIHKVELWAHSAILIISTACALFPIPMKMYNNGYHSCFLAAYPEGCEKYRPDVPCERGGDSFPYFVFFVFFPLWPAVIAITVIMFLVYRQVQKAESSVVNQAWGATASSVAHSENQHDENEEHNDEHDDQQDEHDDQHDKQESSDMANTDANVADTDTDAKEVNRSRSQAVRRQALLFVLAFLATRFVAIIATVWLAVWGESNLILYVLAFDVFLPMQGVFNALVLLRTRTLETPEGKCAQRAFDALGTAWTRIKRQWLHPVFSFLCPVGRISKWNMSWCTSSPKVDDESPAVQVTPEGGAVEEKSVATPSAEAHPWAHESNLFHCTNPEFGVETESRRSEPVGMDRVLQE